jgi:hypothetical protein
VVVGLALLLRPGASAGEEKKGDEREQRGAALVEKITPALVTVHRAKEKAAGEKTHARSGLGVIVDPRGIVVLPRRLLEGAGALEVVLSDGRKRAPKAVFSDAKADLGIIQLEGDGPLPCAYFGDSDRVKVGDFVRSFDLAFGREVTMERGVISGKRGDPGKGGERLFMDSARSYPSDRDLLFDREGKVLGVWTRTGAVPGNRAREAIRQFLDKKDQPFQLNCWRLGAEDMAVWEYSGDLSPAVLPWEAHVDPTHRPMRLDVINNRGWRSVLPGIFEVEGGRLVWVTPSLDGPWPALNPSGEYAGRPTAFTSTPANGCDKRTLAPCGLYEQWGAE